MAITRFGNNRYEGLTSDTKPTNVPAGAIFRDTQTDEIYEYNGSSWDIIIGRTKTETLTNKTVDSISNTVKNVGNYKYTIFKDGSTYYCRNNQTGAIEISNTSPNTVLQYPLTNGGSVYVQGGDYVLTGSPAVYFTFPVEPLYCHFEMSPNTTIVVPDGSTSTIFKFANTTSQHCKLNKLIGGKIEETGAISKNWTGILLEATGTVVKGISMNEIRNISIWWADKAIKLSCDSTCTHGFVNTNFFTNVGLYGAKTSFVEFVMDTAYITAQNGMHRNRFMNVLAQNSNTAHTVVGFRDVRHRENSFINCYVVDFGGSNVAGMTVHADATDTEILFGTADTYNFTDAGTNTKTFTETLGLSLNKMRPTGANGTIEITPLSGNFNTTSWYNTARTERFYYQGNTTNHLFDFVRQTTGGALKPVLFRQFDVPGGGGAVEAFRINTDSTVTFAQNITMADTRNIVLNTTTGTKIGTAATQKLGFYNATPVTQRAFVAAPTGGGTTDAEARTAINSIRQLLIDLGLMAPS